MSIKRKILVVDDDPQLRKLLTRNLEGRSYVAISTDNGSEALVLTREVRPDLVLADANMPGLDGHTLCRVIRQEPATKSIPLIIMTGALVDEKNVLAGLEGGADDYVLKPFSMPVLIARIEAVLRRYDSASHNVENLKKSGLELDAAGRSVKVDGKPVSLTRKEFDLLMLLMTKPGRVLSVPFLLENVWGYDLSDYNDPSTVEVHISHLRKKLGRSVAKRIVNITGNGYKFEEQNLSDDN